MDLVIAVGGGGQHIALSVARLLRIGALAEPIEAFVIDADSDSRLAVKLRSFGNTVSAGCPHPLEGAEAIIPPFARENIGAATQAILAAQGLTFSDIGRFVCHPGGMKVIEALEEALPIGPGALVQERAVLKDHGNMSAVTVLAVLRRTLAGTATGPHLMAALGPGFSVGMCLLDLL